MTMTKLHWDASERRYTSYTGNYADAAILARVQKAHRAGHLEVVVSGGSYKCGYKWPFCAPNGVNGQNRGMIKRRTKPWEEAAKRAWLLSRHTSAPDVRERRSLSRRDSSSLHWARGAYGSRKRQRKKRPLPSKHHARRKGRPVDLPNSLRNWPKRWGHLLLRT